MAVQWIVPEVEHLSDYLAATAMTALRGRALGTGQVDPFENVMQAVTTRVRNEVAPKWTLSETEFSVPPSLLQITCLLIIEAMQGRLPGVHLTERHESMLTDGRDLLKRVNAGKVPVEEPTDPEEESAVQSQGRAEVAYSRTRVATRDLLAGL